jgi:thymidylate kinase
LVIVLEGCDGAGKSTLAKMLCDTLGYEYHHEGPPPADMAPIARYGGLLEAYRWAIHRRQIKGVVLDRFALGERVYGPIYRNNERLSADEWKLIRRQLRAADALHVICMPKFEVCLSNWQARDGEMIRDPEILRRVYDKYLDHVKEDPLGTHWIYDYTQVGDWSKLLDFLEAGSYPLPPGIIGSPTARFLFIGERGAEPESPTADVPFFGMENSSGYLNRALEAAGFDERDIALTNAERWDGETIEWPETMRPVALGPVARKACERRHRKFAMVPHPSFWKRFHSQRFDDYVEMLKGIRDEY